MLVSTSLETALVAYLFLWVEGVVVVVVHLILWVEEESISRTSLPVGGGSGSSSKSYPEGEGRKEIHQFW